MIAIKVTPNAGIGQIQLGMHQCQVEEILNLGASSHNESALFGLYNKIEYDAEQRVKFVEFSNPLQDDVTCLFEDIDLFRTQAEDLIQQLDRQSPYRRNGPEPGYIYLFPEYSMALWRAEAVTEDELLEAYQNSGPDRLEEERQRLYFMTVAIAVPGYWD